MTAPARLPESPAAPEAARCPVDHTVYSRQKTAKEPEQSSPALERDAAGVWHARGFETARQVLRGGDTRQAGFKAEMIARMNRNRPQPILYQEGTTHLRQRKQTARFFTPTATSANYRKFMQHMADEIVAGLAAKRRGDLSHMSMRLAVQVASQVVGLTNSRRPGIDRRLDSFFSGSVGDLSLNPRALYGLLRNQVGLWAFYFFDVQPAIKARRKAPQADVISHLIEQGYDDPAILIECVTYGAAGMVTTREFISVCAWHFLEQPELRARYLEAEEQERHQILHEMLRLEPVVAHLYRRTTADLTVESDGQRVTIPAGDLVDMHIYAANADEQVTGADPLAICPGRKLNADKATAALLSFGDGHHRCPGAYIAIQETDIFLTRLLRLPGLHIERPPTLTWNDLSKSYELRQFILALS